MLEAAGCYQRRDDAIRMVCPRYGPGWKSKIVLPSVVDCDSFRLFSVVVQAPDGDPDHAPPDPRRVPRHRRRDELQAAHAQDARVLPRRPAQLRGRGHPNRLEYDQGFFVKLGDGAADVKPIAHLYKTQVYALADILGVPEEIRTRPADDRHLLAAAVAGGVLLLAALRPDGPVPVRQEQRRPGRRDRRRARPDAPSRSSACSATSTPSARWRAISTRRPSPSPRQVS